MLALGLLIVGIASRFIEHVPNFSPVIAIALFSGVYIKRKWALVLPVGLMVVTDVFLGFYPSILLTWVCVGFIAFMGTNLRAKKNPMNIMGYGLLSAITFFVVTNFGVWLLSGIYELSWVGLSKCFSLAIPFFRYTLAGTFVYSIVLFGVYEIVAARLKDTKYAYVL